MKIKHKTNFAGYFALLRGVQLLLKSNTLTFTELGVFICLVAQADFDSRHKYYQYIIRDDKEIATELGCNPSTINRHRKSLIQKGLLTEVDGLTKITNFHIFELEWAKVYAKFPSETLQSLFAKPHNIVAKEQTLIAKAQTKQDQKHTQSFNISSKGELGLSEEDIREINNIKEIDE